MGGNLNLWLGIGHVGRDPEIRNTQSGAKIANVSVACTERWKQNGEKKESTFWARCVAFGPLADVIEQYVHKGDKIRVQGRLTERKWQDQSGADRYSTEVILSEMEMLGSPDRDHAAQRQQSRQSADPRYPPGGASGGNWGPNDDLSDEIPFSPCFD